MTDVQKVYDAFQIKIPDVDFTNKECQVYMFLQAAIAKVQLATSKDLSMEYDDVIHEGYFVNDIEYKYIELISMYMVAEYYQRRYSHLMGQKQFIGTKDFNKLPDKAKELSSATDAMKYWDSKIYEFRQEFYNYEDI